MRKLVPRLQRSFLGIQLGSLAAMPVGEADGLAVYRGSYPSRPPDVAL